MKRMVVMGHGGYAEGVRQNMEMIAGLPERIYFIDLMQDDDLAGLESKVQVLLEDCGSDEVLFACDLLGASPFRVAAMQCAEHPGRYCTVAGLNTMAFLEVSMNLDNDMSVEELANLAVETAKAAVAKFPE